MFLSSVNLNDELFLHNLIPLYCSYVHNVLYYTYIVSEVFLTILTYKLTWKVFSKSYQTVSMWRWSGTPVTGRLQVSCCFGSHCLWTYSVIKV